LIPAERHRFKITGCLGLGAGPTNPLDSQIGLRPWITLMSKTAIAITRRMWMKP
jgi:hypothetical protein